MRIETRNDGYMIENYDGESMLIPFDEVSELATLLLLEKLRSRITEEVSCWQYELDFDKYGGSAPDFVDEVMAGIENQLIEYGEMPTANIINQEIELVAGYHYMIIKD